MSKQKNIDPNILYRIASKLFDQPITDLSFFRRFDYCIAMDIGGGNCSAAIADLRKDFSNEPRLLKMTTRGDTSLWSNIGYDMLPGEDGISSIGRLATQKRRYHYSNYKTVPTDMALGINIPPDNYPNDGSATLKRTVEELSRDYIHAMFEGILRQNENAFLREVNPKKLLIIVGHPSSDEWKNAEARNNLAKLVKEATGISAVLTTSESNAAILYALKTRSQLSQFKGNLQNGENSADFGKANKVLIIDLGAYSVDITFIDRKNLKHCCASIPLGAKYIDENLVAIILKKSGVDPKDISSYNDLRYVARLIKENFWPLEQEDGEASIKIKGRSDNLTIPVTKADFHNAIAQMPIAVENVATGATESRSYLEHLKHFLTSAEHDLGISSVDWVLVTGGAARMTPAMQTIHATANALWNVSKDHIWPREIQDAQVDEAVPFGSLMFCQKAQELFEKLPSVHERLLEECRSMISPMTEAITEKLTDYVMEKILKPQAAAFRDADNDRSLKQLEQSIQREFNKDIHQKEIIRLCSAAAETIATGKQAAFQSLITNFLEKLYQRTANRTAWTWNTAIQPDIDISDTLSKTIQESVVSELLQDIVGMLAMLLFSLFGLLILVAEEIADWWRRNTYSREEMDKYLREQKEKREREEQEVERRKQEEYTKPRNWFSRINICRKMTNDDARSELKKGIYRAVHNQLEEACDENGFGIPEAYLNSLTEDICKAVYTGL